MIYSKSCGEVFSIISQQESKTESRFEGQRNIFESLDYHAAFHLTSGHALFGICIKTCQSILKQNADRRLTSRTPSKDNRICSERRPGRAT